MRQPVSSGTPWEPIAGYSRGVRLGNVVEVGGTTAQGGDVIAGGGDVYAQTQWALAKIRKALSAVANLFKDVVSTRIFVTYVAQWEAVGRAPGEVFGEIRPVTSMVEVKALIDPQMLMGIEATAIIST